MMHVLIRGVDNERIQRRLFEMENLGFFQYHLDVPEYGLCVWGVCVEGLRM